MSERKSSRVNREYKTKYRVRNWSEYGRASGAVGTSRSGRAKRRSPSGHHRRTVSAKASDGTSNLTMLTADAASRLPPTASPDRGLPRLAAQPDGPRPQGPGPLHTLATEPKRRGAASDPSPRRPNLAGRRLHGAQDPGFRRVERAQVQGIEETAGLAETAHRCG